MDDKVSFLLQRINSRLFAQLWLFYRDYFPNDSQCLDFLFRALQFEPEEDKTIFNMHGFDDEQVADEELLAENTLFIPRRMLNTVMRMVSAARDMEIIRHGKDAFKIVYLVSCVERLQLLRGCRETKKTMLFQFFSNFTSEGDKKYISNRFSSGEYIFGEHTDPFCLFVEFINTVRNAAAHEGEYWNPLFSNTDDDYPLIVFPVNDHIGNTSPKSKKTFYRTAICYRSFETIFVRNCIAFIEDYVKIISI